MTVLRSVNGRQGLHLLKLPQTTHFTHAIYSRYQEQSTHIPFTVGQTSQPLSLALCVSPIVLLTGAQNGWLNHLAPLELLQVCQSPRFKSNQRLAELTHR